jgi:hypothetical protein
MRPLGKRTQFVGAVCASYIDQVEQVTHVQGHDEICG